MSNIKKLLDVMKALRDPDTGCPWDLEQSFATIAPYTIEEAYEVADAVDGGDMGELRDELGDLLFQVVFHAQMADDGGYFDFDDVAAAITQKMTRRHPHVFGSAAQRAKGAEVGSWEALKAAERTRVKDGSAMAGVAKAIPALSRAHKLGSRASRTGFDWPDRRGVRDKISEELTELEDAVGARDTAAIEDEFGDLLFAVVNMARHLDIDPEAALRRANTKFERRFRDMECQIVATGRSLEDYHLEDLETYWRAAKARVG
jgi:MazG family protein